MKDSYRIAVMGSSEATFSEGPPQNATAELLASDLASRLPAARWETHAAVLYQMPNMPERALEFVARTGADIAVLLPSGSAMSEEKVSYSIYHRWPRLYPPIGRATELLKGVAGGGDLGSDSARGWIFRGPKRLAEAVIGRAPLVLPDVAYEATRATLDALVGVPGLKTIVRLAVPTFQERGQAKAIRARVAEYNRFVKSLCEERGVLSFDPLEKFFEIGRSYELMPDNLHASLETRRLIASWTADLVLESLGLTGYSAAARPA